MQTCLHLIAFILLSVIVLSDLFLWSPLGTVVTFVLQNWVYTKCAPLEIMMTFFNKDLGKILFMNYLTYDKLQLCKQVASLVAVKLVLHEGDKYLQVIHIDDYLILHIFFSWFCYLFVMGCYSLTSFTQKELESLQGKRIKLDVARCCPSNIRLSCWVVWSLLYSMVYFFIYCKFGNRHLPCSGMKNLVDFIPLVHGQ